MATQHIHVLLHPASFKHLEVIRGSKQLAEHIREVTVTERKKTSHQAGTREQKDLLVQAFKDFTRLESIWVDTFSFFEPTTGQGVVRCGAETIGDLDDDSDADDDDDKDVDVSYRVYDLVLQALFDAGKHLSVAIHLDFPSSNGNTPPGLSLHSAHWRECSPQARSLTFSGYTDTEWHKTLLQSTPFLEHLTFNSCGTLKLKELTQNISTGLRSFELDDAFCSGSDLTEFFARHLSSLTEIRMINVQISGGDWLWLEKVMQSMPKLESLQLSRLGTF